MILKENETIGFFFVASLLLFIFFLPLLSLLPLYSSVNHFFFTSSITLALLRRFCYILEGLRGTPRINLLGQ